MRNHRNTPFPNSLSLMLNLAGLLLISCFLIQPVYGQDELKFAWPVPSRVTVLETVLKKGKTAKMQYDIVLTAQTTGKNREVCFDKFQFLEIDGTDLSVPENREKLGPVLSQVTALGSIIPTLVINPEGKVEDIIGVEDCVEYALKLLPSADPNLSAMLRSPAMIVQMKQKSVDFWRVWVEMWLMCQAAPGKNATIEIEIPIIGGQTITAPLTVRNEGPSGDTGGDIRLSAETVLQGEPAKKAMQHMMQALVSKIPVKEGVKPFSPDMIKSMKRSSKFLVITNPKTLQPRRAESESIIELTIEEQSKTETEKHEYVFDWMAKAGN
ncbi:MAG: hypothetical protein SGJ27_22210 [Candidatus Melainabacteria bacterium]|nr:hypothetical protein [Candidatus Melainabacteria bacterium]